MAKLWLGRHSPRRSGGNEALPNGLPAIVTFLAASLVGTAAPLNPGYRCEEFEFFLKDTAARLLIARHAWRRRGAARRRKWDSSTHSDAAWGWRGIPGRRSESCLGNRTFGRGRCINFAHERKHRTAKACTIQHANLTVSAANIADAYALTPNDVALCVMPLFHIHGLVASTLAPLFSGGAIVVPTSFNPLAFWRMVGSTASLGTALCQPFISSCWREPPAVRARCDLELYDLSARRVHICLRKSCTRWRKCLASR